MFGGKGRRTALALGGEEWGGDKEGIVLLVRGPSWTLTPLARIPDIPPASEGGVEQRRAQRKSWRRSGQVQPARIPSHQGGTMFVPPPGLGEAWSWGQLRYYKAVVPGGLALGAICHLPSSASWTLSY